jgi:uncharacterized protein (TIGR03083 family)
MAPWTHDRHRDAAEAEIAAFAAAVRDADPRVPVPGCPGWALDDLARHLGTVHRWAEALIRTGEREPVSPRRLGVAAPEEPGALVPWFEEGGTLLLKTLRSYPPETPVWCWGAGTQARWWSRRILHETLVHRCDAEVALGRTPMIADAEVAVDGIGELLENLPSAAGFSPKINELRGAGAVLAFEATDAGTRWDLTLRPDGFEWNQSGGGPREGTEPDAAVQAAAADLYLFMWGRVALDDPRLNTSGDEALLTLWTENSGIG